MSSHSPLLATVGTALLAASIAAGCTANHQTVDGTIPSVASIRWSGTVTPVQAGTSAHPAGSRLLARALIVPGHSGTESYAILSLSGASAGDRHPWHVHTGRCASPGEIIGAADAYPPLLVRADGNGQAMATLPWATPGDATYYVDIHAPTGSAIIACGDLTLEETRLPPPDR